MVYSTVVCAIEEGNYILVDPVIQALFVQGSAVSIFLFVYFCITEFDLEVSLFS